MRFDYKIARAFLGSKSLFEFLSAQFEDTVTRNFRRLGPKLIENYYAIIVDLCFVFS